MAKKKFKINTEVAIVIGVIAVIFVMAFATQGQTAKFAAGAKTAAGSGFTSGYYTDCYCTRTAGGLQLRYTYAPLDNPFDLQVRITTFTNTCIANGITTYSCRTSYDPTCGGILGSPMNLITQGTNACTALGFANCCMNSFCRATIEPCIGPGGPEAGAPTTPPSNQTGGGAGGGGGGAGAGPGAPVKYQKI